MVKALLDPKILGVVSALGGLALLGVFPLGTVVNTIVGVLLILGGILSFTG